MKKTVSFFLSFVLLLSAVFCVPGFSASAAVYKPDRKLYSQAYMLLSLDDPSFPVVAEKNQNKRMYPAQPISSYNYGAKNADRVKKTFRLLLTTWLP